MKDYIYKGYSIDSKRFKGGTKFDVKFFDELLEEIREIRAIERMAYQKITDIYATSVDYVRESDSSARFFASVQNKLHFAITGHTAAEIVHYRADSKKLFNKRRTFTAKQNCKHVYRLCRISSCAWQNYDYERLEIKVGCLSAVQ